MGHPEHRHDGTFYKRHLLRQGFEASLDPSALRREKAQTGAWRYAARQNELDRAFGRIDPESDPPRPRADPDRDRSADRRLPMRVVGS